MDNLEDEIRIIRESQIRMEEDINHHIRRTDELQELHIDNRVRIEKLEEPMKARKYLLCMLIDIGKFTGFIISILAILRYFGKI